MNTSDSRFNTLHEQMLQSADYLKFVNQSDQAITIDCGHAAVSFDDGRMVFLSNNGAPSATEIESFRLAMRLAKDLIETGKNITIHISFSDVNHHITVERRNALRAYCANKTSFDLLPDAYKQHVGELESRLTFSHNFQASNSNKASAEIKKVKKKLLQDTNNTLRSEVV